MSVELVVYLRRDQLPTRDGWQAVLDAEGIDLRFNDVNTVTQTGFWPMKLGAVDCRFEYWFDRIEDEEPDEILGALGDRDHRATFVFHSSLDDCRAASFPASVLAKLANGILYDPQGGE